MATEGATFFFDMDANFLTGFTSTLRTEILFGDIADGVGGSAAESDKLYEHLVQGALLQEFVVDSAYSGAGRARLPLAGPMLTAS